MIVTYPTNDSREHDIGSTACECGPRIEFVFGNMIIHHQQFDKSIETKWAVDDLGIENEF